MVCKRVGILENGSLSQLHTRPEVSEYVSTIRTDTVVIYLLLAVAERINEET